MKQSRIISFHSIIFLILLLESISFAEPIKIGILSPPQSKAGDSFKSYLWGAEMAAAEVNAREGIQGIQFLLVLRGGNFSREKDLRELKDFLIEERILFLLGRIEQESILPVADLARAQKIPFLVFPVDFLETPSTAKEPGNLFWMSPAPEAFQRAAVRTVAQFPQNRFFLLARDSSSGRSWAKYFWEALRRLKPDTHQEGEIFQIAGKKDFGDSLKKILDSRAEICVSYLGPQDWIHFALTAKRQGYFKKIIHFEVESANQEILTTLKKEAPDGVWGINTFPFWFLEGKETQGFVQKYRNKTGLYPGIDALSGYGSISAIFEAMKKAGSSEPAKVMESLSGLSFPSPVGSVMIRKMDRRALWPIWCGVSSKVMNYPFPILKELKAFGPDSFLTASPQEEAATEVSPREKAK